MDTALSRSPMSILPHQPRLRLAEVSEDVDTPHCPFVTSLNPQVALAEQRGLAWARNFALLTSPKAIVDGRLEYVRLCALVHPQADLERLQVVADYFTWLFMLDDERDETSQEGKLDVMAVLHDRFIEILKGSETQAQDNRFSRALADLRMRIAKLGTEAILSRFATSTSRYFRSVEWEAVNRSQGIIPDVKTYLHMRTETGAVYTCFDLIQVTDCLDLPDSAFEHPVIRRLSWLANRVVSVCNDIYSVKKERQHNDVHNLVIVLQHEHRCDFQEARRRAIAIHNQDVAEFIELAKRIPKFSPTIDFDIARYVDGLRTWMRANYEFSLTAARYHCA